MLGINEKTNGIFPSYSFSFDNWFLFLLGLFSFTQGCIYFHIPKDYYRLVRANSQSSVMVKLREEKDCDVCTTSAGGLQEAKPAPS